MTRPSEYTPSMIKIILRLADNGGASIAKMCQACGISKFSTFEKYRKDNPEFDDAVEICKMARISSIREKVDESALGEAKIDFKSAQWSLYNYDKEQFPLSDKAAAAPSLNLKIGNLNIANINQLSGSELDDMIKQLETSVAAIQESQLPKIETSIKPEGDVIDVSGD